MAWRSGPRTASSAVTRTRAWERVRRAVLERDGGACGLRLPGCIGTATQVDKVVPVAAGGSPWDPANLRAVCEPCHGVKTQEDAAAGRAARGSVRRPAERHPGLL